MIGLGFIKRFFPFVAALAIGIFITSLFVDIRWWKFNRGHHRQSYRELKMENERLRVENEQLRQQVGDVNFRLAPGTIDSDDVEVFGVPIAPMPPAAPREHNSQK